MFKTKNTRIRTFSYYLYSILFFYKYLQKKSSKRRTPRSSTFSYYLYSILFFISITKKLFKTKNPEDSIVLAMRLSIQSELWTLKNLFF